MIITFICFFKEPPSQFFLEVSTMLGSFQRTHFWYLFINYYPSCIKFLNRISIRLNGRRKREHEQEHSHEHHRKTWLITSEKILGSFNINLRSFNCSSLISTISGGLTGNISSKVAGEKFWNSTNQLDWKFISRFSKTSFRTLRSWLKLQRKNNSYIYNKRRKVIHRITNPTDDSHLILTQIQTLKQLFQNQTSQKLNFMFSHTALMELKWKKQWSP